MKKIGIKTLPFFVAVFCCTATAWAVKPAAPQVTSVGDGCSTIKFRVENFDAAQFTYMAQLNDGLAIELHSADYEALKPERDKDYTLKVTATNTAAETSDPGSATAKLPAQVADPILQTNDGCDNAVQFTITNYNPALTYTWHLDGIALTVADPTSYQVPNPVEGQTYTAEVTATDLCTTSAAVTASQTYKVTPAAPTVIPYEKCQVKGTQAYADLVDQPIGELKWYRNEMGGAALTDITTFDTNVPATFSLWVSQTNAAGCESPRAEVKVTIYALPDAPVVTPYNECQVAGLPAQKWSTLVAGADHLNLKWYETEDAPGAVSEPLPFDKNKVQVTSYWVSQISDKGCESKRVEVKVTVKAMPATPVVDAYADCQSSGTQTWASLITNKEADLVWYQDATTPVAMVKAPADFDKNIAQNTSYWVAQQSVEGCQTERVEVNVTVNAIPTAPQVTQYESCQTTGTQSWESLVTATEPTLKWYKGETTPDAISTPTDFNKMTVGEISYWVSQVSAAGCESARSQVIVTVYAVPAAPQVESYHDCQKIGTIAWKDRVTATEALVWYDAEMAVDPMVTPPTTFDTNVPQNKTYWVSQKSATGCESSRVPLNVTVNEIPAAPVTQDYKACQLVGTANWVDLVTLTADHLNWYEKEDAPSPVLAPTTYNQNEVGEKSYWVAQVSAAGCESARSKVTVKVNAIPAQLQVESYNDCQKPGKIEWVSRIQNATETVVWYDDELAPDPMVTPPTTFDTNVPQNKTYWVSQKSVEGCESPRVPLNVTVNEIPAAPVTHNYIACQTAGVSLWTDLVELTADHLNWYDEATATTLVPAPTTFDQNEVGEKSYWVSQVSATGCESLRSKVTVKVNAIPADPEVQDYHECQMVGTQTWESLVTHTGKLKWYKAPGDITTITVSSFDQNVVGETTYWVSQSSAEGCESGKVAVTVHIEKVPKAFAGDDQTICAGGTVTLGAAPELNVNYEWQPAILLEDAQVANPKSLVLNASTVFTLKASNALMPTCSSEDQVEITVSPRPVIELESKHVPLCPHSSTTLKVTNASPDITYTWTPDIFNYAVGPEVTTVVLDAPQDVEVEAFYNASPTCTSKEQVKLLIATPPVADAGPDQKVCINGTTQVGVPGVEGVEYSWSPADKVDDPTIPNPFTTPITEDRTYTLTAKLAAAPFCESTSKVKITKVLLPNQYTVSGDNQYCIGGSTDNMTVRLSHSDANVEYILLRDGVEVLPDNWIPGTGTKMEWNNNPAGVYTVRARMIGLNSCQQDMLGQATIDAYDPPVVVEFKNRGSVACPGDLTTIYLKFKGTAPFDGVLSIDGVNRTFHTDTDEYHFDITPMGRTEMEVISVTDFWCENIYPVDQRPPLVLELDNKSDYEIHSSDLRKAICPGDAVDLYIDYTGTTSDIQWSTGEKTTKITVIPAKTTKYYLRVLTESGCEVTDSIQINVGNTEELDIIGVKDEDMFCSSHGKIKLEGKPLGGAFSSEPANLLEGNYIVPGNIDVSQNCEITYTYAETGCVQEKTIHIYVSAVPTEVDWAVMPDVIPYQEEYNYCQPNPLNPKSSFILQGFPQQKNGTWKIMQREEAAQATITVISEEYSTAALDNVTAGSLWIQYRITDELGCVGTKEKKIIIRNEKQELIDNEGFWIENSKGEKTDKLCSKDKVATLWADHTGGTYRFNDNSMIIPGTQKPDEGTVKIDPSKAPGLGKQMAIYTFIDAVGCPFNQSMQFDIKSPVNVESFGLKSSYCSYDADVPLEIKSPTPTTGVISVYKDGEVIMEVTPSNPAPVFRPTWGAGQYEVVYTYSDGTCQGERREKTTVYDPPKIEFNLESDYCKGDEIPLKAEPLGGEYGTSTPTALVNNIFYTAKAGLGVHEIYYTVNEKHGCVRKDTAQIQVRGVGNMEIFGLEPQYCEPQGMVELTGFPTEFGTVHFSGAGITNSATEVGKATLDLSHGNFETTYPVTYHFVEKYTTAAGHDKECESKLTKSYRILNEASDFGGYNHLENICGDREEVKLAANHKDNVTFTFSEPGSPALVDNGDGTAVLYPTKLEEGFYSVTMHHDLLADDGVTVLCSSEKEKSFSISRIAEITDIRLYCDNGNTAVRLDNTEPGVTYQVSINNALFHEVESTGGEILFPGFTHDDALVKVSAREKNCTLGMSKTFQVKKLKALISTKNDVSCNGLKDGKLVATVTGGGFPYEHKFVREKSDPSEPDVTVVDSIAAPLPTGKYIFTVKDTIGCERQVEAVITEPLALTLRTETQDADCSGNTTGVARAIPGTGTGTPPYFYSWVNLADPATEIGKDATIKDLETGQYQVTVTDQNGCTIQDMVNIFAPQPLVVGLHNKTDIKIIGQATGAIEIDITGGDGNYTYEWQGNGITDANRNLQNPTNLTAGNYYLTATDGRGCKANLAVTLVEPTPFVVQKIVEDVKCNGGKDGSITLKISGGDLPYGTATWTYPDGTQVPDDKATKGIKNLVAGVYHFSITDAKGNLYENDYKVDEPSLLAVETDITSNFSVPCHGDESANIDITISGGTLDYIVEWQGIRPDQKLNDLQIQNLGKGIYQVKVTDANGCQVDLEQEVTEPLLPLAIKDIQVVQNNCHGTEEGSIHFNVEGGTPFADPDHLYHFTWTGPVPVGQTTAQNQDNLPAGNYSVRVVDANGCEDYHEFVLDNPALFTITTGSQDVTCHAAHDGKVWVTATGGTPTYHYEWYDAADQLIVSDREAQNLGPGDYKVIVRDDKGCELSATETIIEPDELKAEAVWTDVICQGENNGTAQVNVEGGNQSYVYEWYQVGKPNAISYKAVIDHLPVAEFFAIVKDKKGCQVTTNTIKVTEPAQLTVRVEAKEDVKVYGEATGKIVVKAEGGTPDALGDYQFTWTAGPSIDDTNRHATDLDNLKAGFYYLEVVDEHGCQVNLTVEITQPEIIDIVETITNVSCNGGNNGSIEIVVAGGDGNYTFAWTSDNGFMATTQNITKLSADKYTILVTDGEGAFAEKTFEVTEPKSWVVETVEAFSNLEVDCFGNKNAHIRVNVEGGTTPYTTEWSGPDVVDQPADYTILENIGVGNYQLKVKDVNGCIAPAHFQEITGPLEPIKIDGKITENKCYGDNNGQIDLTVTGGTAPYTYRWSGGEGLVPDAEDQTTLHPGQSYQVDVIDAHGCTASKVFTMADRTEMLVSVTTDNVSCFGRIDGALHAVVVGGQEPLVPKWSNEDGTFVDNAYDVTALGAGKFNFQVTDAFGCHVEMPAEITQPNELTVDIQATKVLCLGVDDGQAYASIPDGAGTQPYQIKWFKDDVQCGAGSHITGLGEGFYTVEVEDAHHCTAKDNTTINSSVPMVIDNVVIEDVSIHGGDDGSISLTVSGGTQPLHYEWTGVGIDPMKANDLTQQNLIAGKYYFTVTDGFGCSLQREFEVKQPESMEVSARVKLIDCFGDKGFIELSVTGGYDPYVVEWTADNGFTSDQLKIYDLDPGIYNVSIEDAKHNKYKNTFEIPAKKQLAWTILPSSKTALNCNGDKDGVINIEVSGGTRPYSIDWTGPDLAKHNAYSVFNLGVGQYTAIITDKKGCLPTSTLVQEITEPSKMVMESTEVHNDCAGGNVGAIYLTVTGGTPDYTFQWSGIGVKPNAQDQEDLRAGNYDLILQDQNGCEIKEQFIIHEKEQITATITGKSDICQGEEYDLHFAFTGVAPWQVDYTDGEQIYHFTANNQNEVQKHIAQQSVRYQLLQVIDGNGCEAELKGEIPVTVHLVPEVSIQNIEEDCCLGGAAYVDLILANEGPWTVRYNNGEQEFKDGPITEEFTHLEITPAEAGTKHYTLLDVSNEYCTVEVNKEFDVTAYQNPTLDVLVAPYVCEPNPLPVELNATGDAPWTVVYYLNDLRYEYEMKTPNEVIEITNYQPHNEFLFESVRSGSHCVRSLGKKIQAEVGLLPADATEILGPNQVCRNSTEVFTTPAIPEAEQYEWILPEGFTITSGLGSNKITVDIAGDAKDGVMEVWGKNGCGIGVSAKLQLKVDVPMDPTGVIISAPVYVCHNDNLFQLSLDNEVEGAPKEVIGATEYEWIVPEGYKVEAGQGTRSVLLSINEYAQSAKVQVIAKNRCTETAPIEQFISIRPLPLAEAGMDFTTACSADAQLHATEVENAIAKWTLLQGRGEIEEPTSATTHVHNLLFGPNEFRWDVNDGYCLNFDTVVVTNDNPGITEPEIRETTICESTIKLRAQRPPFGKSRWTIIAGDGLILNPDTCETDVIDLGTKVPNIIRWEVYSATCSNSIDIQVISHNLDKLTDAGEDGKTATGHYRLSARSLAHTNATGEWSVVAGSGTIDNPTNHNTVVHDLATGVNTLRWTVRGYDCESYDEIQIYYYDEPVAGFTVQNPVGCEPFSVPFDNTTIGEATYEWDFGDGTGSTERSPEHIFQKAGVYTVVLTAKGEGRTDQAQAQITVHPSPVAAFTVHDTQLYVPNAEAHFFNESEKMKAYYWDFGDGEHSEKANPTHKYQEDGLYDVTLVVTDKNTCKDTLTQHEYIHVGRASFIVFPTAFTPRVQSPTDGIYAPEERRLDIFYPVSRNVETYKLQIYNQWGTEVFQTTDLYQGWNGYYQGQCAAQGTYIYKVEGKFRDGSGYRGSGNVLLIR